jgi:hypothetical protein
MQLPYKNSQGDIFEQILQLLLFSYVQASVYAFNRGNVHVVV